MNTRERCAQANMSRYASGDVVCEYLKEEYHKIRISVALEMINKSFKHNNRKDIRILDIAAADGTIAQLFKNEGYNVTCADLSVDQLQHLQKYGIKTVKCDACDKLPFENDQFSCIFAGDIVEHLFDIDTFFKECHRILKTGGIIVITTPNLAALQDRLKFLIGHSPTQIQPCHEYYKLHIHPFTLSSLLTHINVYGFDTVDISSNFVTLKYQGKNIVKSKWLAKLLPGIGRSLIVCGQKR